MKVFYDTEFLERGQSIVMISIGMVRDDGAEYYAVNLDMSWRPVYQHRWLRDNVWPHLPLTSGNRLDASHPDVKPQRIIRNEISAFLNVDNVELWAWYAAYDHVLLTQLWGGMSILPNHVPQWTNDIRQLVHIVNAPLYRMPKQISGLHNALEDARFNRVRYDWVCGYADNLMETT